MFLPTAITSGGGLLLAESAEKTAMLSLSLPPLAEAPDSHHFSPRRHRNF
jgi:hypothetical protein